VGDLGHGADVEGPVELAVPAWVEPVPVLQRARRGDGCGGVVAGEVAGVGEPGDVCGVAEDDRRAQGADAVHVGDCGSRGEDGFGDPLVERDELAIEPAHIAEKVDGDALAFGRDGLERTDATQDLPRPLGREAPGGTTGGELAQQGVQPTDRLGAESGEVVMAIRQQAQYRRVITGSDPPGPSWRIATMAAGRASWESVLSVRVESSSRTRADRLGGTSRTVSPAATSCWANRAPSPRAPSIAQVRGSNRMAKDSNRSRWRRSATSRSSSTMVSVPSRTAAVWVPL
jgi:hypothetical protein